MPHYLVELYTPNAAWRGPRSTVSSLSAAFRRQAASRDPALNY